MSTFDEVLQDIDERTDNPRDRGTAFERLMISLLPQLPEYRFERVWAWHDWPDRALFTGRDGKDDGIDLVGKLLTDDGEDVYWAIQCKNFAEAHRITKSDIDSFYTASGREPFAHRLIIATTDKWSALAYGAMERQQIPVSIFGLGDLRSLDIDWDFISPHKTRLRPKKHVLRAHQREALACVQSGFTAHDRGRLIMACGTGKTLTALHIAEEATSSSGNILFLVPSIALMSQSLKEWSHNRSHNHRYLAVCSDAQVGKQDEGGRLADLVIPATTDAINIARILKQKSRDRTVVFCTYQSLEQIHQAQLRGAPDFDIVICDEAHRTTGVEIDDKASAFSKIHDSDYVRAAKRLYMTATPRLYTEDAKQSAKQREMEVFSMDNEAHYGPEFYRIDFSQAVTQGLLSDYRVVIFNVNEEYVNETMQDAFAEEKELKLDDISKIVGCYNALRDQGEGENGIKLKRVVSFSGTIKHSEALVRKFNDVVEGLNEAQNDGFTCQLDHVDGKQSALERSKKLDWLRAEAGSDDDGQICRILSNARCLSEGVDVPSLDAIMFMSPRKSQVDIVQAVGRVMRKAAGKDYGYIILPVVIPSGTDPADALNDNKVYGTVWQILNALRSHDDRFNARINSLDTQSKAPEQMIIGYEGFDDIRSDATGGIDEITEEIQGRLELDFKGMEMAILAKIVEKVGDRKYWSTWAKDVASIHEKIIEGIKRSYGVNEAVRSTFDNFHKSICQNINEALTRDDAESMLAQHLITQPVFDALFSDYEFSKSNPVSQSISKVLETIIDTNLTKELEELEPFYKSVEDRAAMVTDAQKRQEVIIELYEKFFKTAFPKTSESLGIAYTPIPIVDFVLRSADYALRQEFNQSLSDEGVHIIDPFTGTGSFINRLLQSDLIKDKDLSRKFEREIHANEILLLAYYIASINIEEAYHARQKAETYATFPGIVLTDTFNLYETKDESIDMHDRFFPENNERVLRQRKAPIRVVVGNPPWSKGQKSANDNAKNAAYPILDTNIRTHYAENSKSNNLTNLYNSYIRAFRWATDRIGDKGIIAYISNGGWIDDNSTDGFRQSLTEEFDAIWVFNARGNARLSGEPRRKEKGNIFGQANRNPVTFTILVKNPHNRRPIADIHYHDIGDYLSEQEKIDIIQNTHHIGNIDHQNIIPNAENDWLNQRDPRFLTYKAIGSKEVKAGKISQPDTIFRDYGRGVGTSRDAWAYNFNKDSVANNMQAMIAFYNEQLEGFTKSRKRNKNLKVSDFIDNDTTKIKWSNGLHADLERGKKGIFDEKKIRKSLYRPFDTEWLYFDKQFCHETSRIPSFFPKEELNNIAITLTGKGAGTDFSALITSHIPNLHFLDTGQTFPRYVYNDEGDREDNITNSCLRDFQTHYKDDTITADDIFYYVYGILHAPDYKTKYAADLKKQLPRIPFAPNFAPFMEAGRKLAKLHLNFETAPEYDLSLTSGTTTIMPETLRPEDYKMKKLVWAKTNKKEDKTRLIYNHTITLAGIPAAALRYQVSGRPALQWLIDRYQVKIDKDSKITNDPNDWIAASGDPQWLIRHIKRITYISMQSTAIIDDLPASI